MTNHWHQLLIVEGTTNYICGNCEEENILVSGGCCEECNWQMYTNEFFEAVASEELEELIEKEEEFKDSNPLENPYLSENYTENEFLFQFGSKEPINDWN